MPTSVVPSAPSPSAAVRLLERLLDRLPFLEKEMLLVRRLVRPGWVCIDIGAAGGTYTHLLSRRTGPTGQVHAFEPRSGSMRYLRRFRRWLRWGNVELHQVALADARGTVRMEVPRFVRTEAHLTEGGGTRSEEVRMDTLDEVVDERQLRSVDLVKCDVEGAELRVLAGADRTLRRFRPIVICEIEARHLRRYGSHPDEVFAWFAERGYRPHRVHAGQVTAVEGVLTDENDYLFLPGDGTGTS